MFFSSCTLFVVVKCFDSEFHQSPYELNKYLISLTLTLLLNYWQLSFIFTAFKWPSAGLTEKHCVCVAAGGQGKKDRTCVCVFMQGPSIGRHPLTRGNIWTFEDYFHYFSSWFGLPQLVVTTHTMTLHCQQQTCTLACSKQHQCTHIAVQIVCMQGLLVLALSW